MKKQLLRLIILIWLSTFFVYTKPSHAAEYIVTNCSDAGFTAVLSSIQSDPAPEGTITFNCGIAEKTIDFSSPKLIIGRITIDGGGAVVLSGMRATRLFEVQSDASLVLRNIILEKGIDLVGNGAAVNVNQNASLHVSKSILRQHRSGASGGAIHSYLGTVSLESSILEDNEAAYGGAIAQNGGTLVLSDTQVLRNLATTGDGGGAQVWNANSSFTFSIFDSNSALGDLGGAVSLRGGSTTITGGYMNSNNADSGGAIAAWDAAKLKLRYVTLGLNVATSNGGGIDAQDGSTLDLQYLTLQGNLAYNGGAMHQGSGKASILDSLFLLNKSSNGAGGALLLGIGSYDIQRSIFRQNAASNNAGGGIYSTGTLHLTNVQLEQNSSAAPGAGLRVVNSTAYLTNTTLYNNAGYGLSTRNVLTGSVILHNSILSRNTPSNCDGDLGDSSHRYSFSDDSSCAKLTGSSNQNNALLAFEAFDIQFGAQKLSIAVPVQSAAAVDAIPLAACIPIDLRGSARPQGKACDAGAVERERQSFGVYLPLAIK